MLCDNCEEQEAIYTFALLTIAGNVLDNCHVCRDCGLNTNFHVSKHNAYLMEDSQ